jgi:hypothetical protein
MDRDIMMLCGNKSASRSMKAPIPDISGDLFDLTGYCSIVTGASVGIGLNIAEALAHRGVGSRSGEPECGTPRGSGCESARDRNPAETEIMARFATLGIGCRGAFDKKALSPEVFKAV